MWGLIKCKNENEKVEGKLVYAAKNVDELLERSRVPSRKQKLFSMKLLDPASRFVYIWNRIFLVACLLALFVDPLILFWPQVEVSNNSSCLNVNQRLIVAVTVMRSLVDLFYVLNIVIKFHSAYISRTSRVFGKGELVMNRKLIARKYLNSDFIIDLLAALPLVQIVMWLVIPAIRSSSNLMVTFIVLIQYIYRLYLAYVLSDQIIKATGVITKSALGGTVYNLLLYGLASHIIGSVWYLSAIARQTTCWIEECRTEFICSIEYLDCQFNSRADRQSWVNSTQVFINCDATNPNITFAYGLFAFGLNFGAVSTNFLQRYFYSLWWGLQQLISAGQQMVTSVFIGETAFCIIIAAVSLVLFGQLIGNMEAYLQSITARVEQWRLKQGDTEVWMKHRQLPRNLRERVKQFNDYKWLTTKGVDEEAILRGLPADLRRDIQRHLCLDLIRRVPFFSEMDNQLLDAICERLVASLSIEGTYIICEGDPVKEMLFIIRGYLESSTTNGGRTDFYNSTILSPGDFSGEELLTWALHPSTNANLPSSTRTVKALSEVEAFALRAEDLNFVSSQFSRLHSKKLQHTFRYYSPQWRTWAACLIQATWRRYKGRKTVEHLGRWESYSSRSDEEVSSSYS